MNREQMVEKAAGALTEHLGGHFLTWDEGSVNLAEVLVDALLPQVNSVEELVALPAGSLLVAQSNSVFTWRCPILLLQGMTTGYDYEPADILANGPMTVVWQP